MKVSRQRNPYLKRIYSQTPHKYSYDMDSGKYYLLDQKGSSIHINQTGTFRAKFRPNYSGFVTHKERYLDSHNDPSVLHFAPNPEPDATYHNPIPDKFAGYAQSPYQLKQLPTYLKKSGDTPHNPRKKGQSLKMRKAMTVREGKEQTQSAILECTLQMWEKEEGQAHFESAWTAMSTAKVLPKQKKKSCHNYKCRYLQQWVFDERGKLELSKLDTSSLTNTLGRSFHQELLTQEMQQSKLVSTMALSGVG